jgi:hypothetical protein
MEHVRLEPVSAERCVQEADVCVRLMIRAKASHTAGRFAGLAWINSPELQPPK